MLDAKDLIMYGGTITDVTMTQAPNSTRNSPKVRNLKMVSTKKGNNHHGEDDNMRYGDTAVR